MIILTDMNKVDRAFKAVDRRNFLPAELCSSFRVDAPLPIGFGQTNSQPSTVKMMLNWLDVKPSDKILDVGSGSGWTTALLAHITGPKGYVYAVERVPELVKYGRGNVKRTGFKNAGFFQAGSKIGLPEYAPYNRILVSAAAPKLPEELINQLKVGGKLVIPIKHDILEISRTDNNSMDVTVHPGFVFVPLLGEKEPK